MHENELELSCSIYFRMKLSNLSAGEQARNKWM